MLIKFDAALKQDLQKKSHKMDKIKSMTHCNMGFKEWLTYQAAFCVEQALSGDMPTPQFSPVRDFKSYNLMIFRYHKYLLNP